MKMNEQTIFAVAMTGMWLSFSLFMIALDEQKPWQRMEAVNADVKDVRAMVEHMQDQASQLGEIRHLLEDQQRQKTLEHLQIELESTKIMAYQLGKDWDDYVYEQRDDCHFHVDQKKLPKKKAQDEFDECVVQRRVTRMDVRSYDTLVMEELDHFEGMLGVAIEQGWTKREVHGQLAESLDDIQETMRHYQRDIDEWRGLQ